VRHGSNRGCEREWIPELGLEHPRCSGNYRESLLLGKRDAMILGQRRLEITWEQSPRSPSPLRARRSHSRGLVGSRGSSDIDLLPLAQRGPDHTAHAGSVALHILG
jgi:hypothetical protein